MKYKKYPRTYHHPLSMAITSDDKRHSTDAFLHNMHVVITEKRDGECSTMYNDHIHARSLDSRDHVSRHWLKSMWSQIKHDIPEDIRICGENMYARHSVEYDNLKSYFEVFNVWDNDRCLSWSETLEYCELLNLEVVPTLYEGIYDVTVVEDILSNMDTSKCEGIVIRNVESFTYENFKSNVTKIVREGHVQTDTHWMHQSVIPNELKE